MRQQLHFRSLKLRDIARYEAYFVRHCPQNRWYNLKHLYIMRHKLKTKIAFDHHAVYLQSIVNDQVHFHLPMAFDKRDFQTSLMRLHDYAHAKKLRLNYV